MASGTIAQRISALNNTRLSIISAINDKGVSLASTAGYNAFPSAIASIQTGGGGSVAEFYVTSGFSNTYSSNYSGSIRGYAFVSINNGLKEVIMPNCTAIGVAAFSSAYIESVNFSACSSIGNYAFAGCSQLTTARFPSCTYVDNGAFQRCKALTFVDVGICETISAYAFANCESLSYVCMTAKTLGYAAFSDCYSLVTAEFTNCELIGSNAFQNCIALPSFSAQHCKEISAYAFRGCSSLSTASFPACSAIYAGAFSSCVRLLSLYLNYSSVVYLYNSSVFTSTPIAGFTSYTSGSYGSVYVPQSLYSLYTANSAWSYFASRITPT